MINFDLIKNALSEPDGGLREVTFTPVALPRLVGFIDFFRDSHHIVKAYNTTGESLLQPLSSQDYTLFSDTDHDLVHIIWESGNSILPWVQGLINWSSPEEYEVELSFYPNDLRKPDFNIDAFVDFLEEMKRVLDCAEYYVRYESASWNIYRPTNSSVIYTGQMLSEHRKAKPVGN
ncbi:MAG: hypothetical protein OT477_23565 [Chloroflexi bacterium]|nr:hypothetical protein [Chloroflexota bacterium]